MLGDYFDGAPIFENSGLTEIIGFHGLSMGYFFSFIAFGGQWADNWLLFSSDVFGFRLAFGGLSVGFQWALFWRALISTSMSNFTKNLNHQQSLIERQPPIQVRYPITPKERQLSAYCKPIVSLLSAYCQPIVNQSSTLTN